MPGDGGRGEEGGVATLRNVSRLLAVAMIALGIVMVVVTLRHGGGIGILLGALFVAAGVGRLYLLSRR